MENITRRYEKNRILIAFILGVLAGMPPLCTDLYLPAFVEIAADLNAEPSVVQGSLASCFFGMAGGQMLFGPLSDMKGRRVLLLLSLVFFVISSFLCALAPSAEVLVGVRFLQGFCGAGGVVLSRAIACDLYSGSELTKFFALLMLINGVVPILGPLVGGQLLRVMNWQGIFVVLGMAGLLLAIAVLLALGETLPKEKRTQGSLGHTKELLKSLWQNKVFFSYVWMQASVMAGFFGYIAASPFVFQELYGLSAEEYGLVFGVNGLGIMLFSQAAGRLSARFGDRRLLKWGLWLMAAAAIMTFVGALLHVEDVVLMMIPIFFLVASGGITMTTSFSLAIGAQSGSAGSASGILGVAGFLAGAVVSPLVGLGGTMTAVPMGIIMVIGAVCALMLYHHTGKGKKERTA